jgi:hypothetical protein
MFFSCFIINDGKCSARRSQFFQQSENQATGNASGANGSIGDSQVYNLME